MTQVVEQDEYYELPRHGDAVGRCCWDYQFRIQLLQSDDKLEVEIGGRFLLKRGDQLTEFDAQQPEGLGPALTLMGKEIDVIRAFKDGSLEISFEDGVVLTAPPDPDYEAWLLVSHTGLMIVSIPGGDLAVWLDPAPSETGGRTV